MSLIKWNKEDLFPNFPSLYDDFFKDDFFKKWTTGTSMPAVNINEADEKFEVEVAVPGLNKEDFKIDVDHNILTISSEKKEEKEEKDKKFTRKEFSFSSFSRSFSIPENVDAEKISARYDNGILKLELPKKAISSNGNKKIEVK